MQIELHIISFKKISMQKENIWLAHSNAEEGDFHLCNARDFLLT